MSPRSHHRLFLRMLLLDFKQWLKYGGFAVFVTGLTCMPGSALSNPKAWTSLFPVLAAAGLVVRFGAVLMVLGVLLFCSSFLIRGDK
jgi:hypothetical protein